MPPAEELWLVQRVIDGTMRTIAARGSAKNAMRSFVARYGPPPGEDFGVKRRGDGGWTYFRTTSRGIRSI
jgi:hypothetical protein